MQAGPETTGIRNNTGNRCAERNTGLLNRGYGSRGDIFLATFRTAHDVLQDESPGDADTSTDQRNRQEQGYNGPGRHHHGNPQ